MTATIARISYDEPRDRDGDADQHVQQEVPDDEQHEHRDDRAGERAARGSDRSWFIPSG